MKNSTRGATLSPSEVKDLPDYERWLTVEAARLGYLEAVRGRPFSPLYETEGPVWQMNYERGRLWAVSFLAVEGFAPAWRAQAGIPEALLDNIERVCRTGSAFSIP